MLSNNSVRYLSIITLLLSLCSGAMAETTTVFGPDLASLDTVGIHVQTEKKGLQMWWNNLVNGNVDRTFEKKVDYSFAVAPYYSTEAGVGIGGQLSGLFRTDRTDSLMQPSDASIMAGISTSGAYSFGIQGNTHFTRDKRLVYRVEMKHQDRNFWGINFQDCNNNVKCHNKINRIMVNADYSQRFTGNWFWGTAFRFAYAKADPDSVSYLAGQPRDGLYTGVGALIQYDSRDFVLNANRGRYFLCRLIYYPHFLGSNIKDVYNTTFQFNAYHRLWQSAILAWDVYAEYNMSRREVPWLLRNEICVDDRRMRGYYSGSYIDENMFTSQVELRQHVYKRLGAVAWVGMGTFFFDVDELHHSQILPNYGVGLRFEMKYRTNIRLDLGFGRGTGGVVFGFGEAF